MRGARHSPFYKFQEINWLIVGVMMLISMMGFVMMVSAGNGEFSPWALQQVVRFSVAFVGMLIIAMMPIRVLLQYAYVFYGMCLVTLIAVHFIGHEGKGAERWLRLGGLNIQPSEFMKLAVILALARYFHQMYPEDIKRPLHLVMPILLLCIPAVLILKQPNLGTTIIMLFVGGFMFFMAGLQWRYFIGLIVSVVSAAPLAWHFLHDYQKRRVLTFLDPQQDPLGAGYNILQSMIAIGSGGFWGKGFLQGSQNQLNFLPEKHTDFIFTMLAEEFGFVGGIFLLLLYILLIASSMNVAQQSRSTFGAMMAAGVSGMLFVHILINVGMVMGMLPVVGVPLPLMSYGGSITMTTVLAIGLVLNAHAHSDSLPVRMLPKL
ncbi:MAG: rod shape-determining protein RodA [Rickettsiales bacterium]|nr:rod shape-determining protein RodA [Rickettsiales bacterium]